MFTNATRKVLLIIAVTICIVFIFEVFTGKVTLSEDNFMQIAVPVIMAFFALKSDQQTPTAGGMK